MDSKFELGSGSGTGAENLNFAGAGVSTKTVVRTELVEIFLKNCY